jgi:hypothetical protein
MREKLIFACFLVILLNCDENYVESQSSGFGSLFGLGSFGNLIGTSNSNNNNNRNKPATTTSNNNNFNFFGGQSQQNQNQNSNRGGQTNTPESPCPAYFNYIDDNGNIEGEIRIKFAISEPIITLDLEANVPAQLSANSNVGTLELINSEKTVSQDIQNGRPLLYRVVFPFQNSIPYITGIYYNNRKICSGPRSNGVSTDIKLTHRLETGLSGSPQPTKAAVQRQPIQYQQPQPQSTRPTARLPSSSLPVSLIDLADDAVCGVPIASQGLIKGGITYRHGDWPWLAAMFRKKDFICGGSIISKRFILTAAHCLKEKGTLDPVVESEYHFVLGVHNVERLDSLAQEIKVFEFYIHPKWNPRQQKYDGDIALAKLTNAIQYNTNIRPACLPPAKTDYDDIIGKSAYVAGWGKTETGAVSTSVPKLVSVPIVSEATCLRSSETFFHLTSPETFCAGGRNNVGPCVGDSGGGLMVRENGKYYVRGIVSVSLRGPDGCDLENFVVFTDVAKYIQWIDNIMG